MNDFDYFLINEKIPDWVNIALYGVATQASTAWSGKASHAIDGNTDGIYWRYNLF